MSIKYFDHPYHLLSLSNRKRDDLILCKACQKPCDGQNYICSEGCDYNLHESCANLPRDVQSLFHPHPLTLSRRGKSYDKYPICNGCYMSDKGFVYRCNANDCNFQLDRECAFMRPVKVKEEDEERQEKLIRTHPYHDHPLLLLEKVPDEHFKCIICLKYCSDTHLTYGCIPCRLFLHEGSCLETKFPPQLQHFYHSHPLTLSLPQSDRDIQCKACYSWGRNVWYYSCKQCDNFVMDIACALLPTTIKSESQIQHFLHGHPLSLGKANYKKSTQHCYVCVKPCTGPIYVCGFCKDIYFHISCLKFPQQICHPFHPYHPVTLVDLRGYKHCKPVAKLPSVQDSPTFVRVKVVVLTCTLNAVS